MSSEPTMREMESVFYGKRPVVTARFYDDEVLDVPASRAAGERINKSVIMIYRECKSENTAHTRMIRPLDHKEFPEAWAIYQKGKEDERHRQVQDCATLSDSGDDPETIVYEINAS